MKNDITVFDVAQLITVDVPEKESCVNVFSELGHEHRGVVATQVMDCLPADETAPPLDFLTLNFCVVKQITERSLILSSPVSAHRCPSYW